MVSWQKTTLQHHKKEEKWEEVVLRKQSWGHGGEEVHTIEAQGKPWIGMKTKVYLCVSNIYMIFFFACLRSGREKGVEAEAHLY